MANEWQVETIEEIAEKVGMGPFGSSIKVSTFVDFGVPIISGQHLNEAYVTDDDHNFITEEHAEKLKGANVFRGDVILTHAGNIGQVSYIPNDSKYAKYVISQRQFYIRGAKGKVDPRFLTYYLRSPEGQHKVLANRSSSGVPSIARPVTYIKSVTVPVPDLKEQRRVADVLGALDDKIKLNRQMNRTLEAMARAIFKAWFVDFEPVKAKAAGATSFRGMPQEVFDQLPARLTESELGPVPEGWDVAPLSSLIELIGGGTPKRKSPEYWGGAIPWFSVRDAPYERDVWVIDTEEKITQLGVDNSSAKVMPEGTTIVSARGTVGRLALTAVPMAMNQSCYGVRGQDSIGDFFVYFTLHDAVADLQQRTHGSVFDTITRKTFDGLTRVRPDTKSLKAFEEVVAPFVLRIRSNLCENQILASIRDTLLPKLISGEIRMPEALEGVDGG